MSVAPDAAAVADETAQGSSSPEESTQANRGRSDGRGRNAPRSRNGCWTCRTKKVKCDEKRPKCARCIRLRLLCDYEPRNAKRGSASAGSVVPSASDVSPGAASTSPPSVAPPGLVSRHHQPWTGGALPLQLLDVGTSASSLELSSADHEAIRYFRTTFAALHHSKSSDFSLYSVMFTLAERDPLIMRSVLALGSREMQYRKTGPVSDANSSGWTSLQHYSEALRLMSDTISNEDSGGEVNLDSLCASLYLMILYEQKHGDANASGLRNHLTGASLIIQQCFYDWPQQVATATAASQSDPWALRQALVPSSTKFNRKLSLFAARVLIYLTVSDASAATFGVGGPVNAVMQRILAEHDAAAPPDEAIHILDRYCFSLYRLVWAENYPQEELLDDLENRSLFEMGGTCLVMRYLIAAAEGLQPAESLARIPFLESQMFRLEQRFGDIIAAASELTTKMDHSRRVTLNMRVITPQYHVLKLQLIALRRRLRYVPPPGMRGDEPSDTEFHVQAIMNIATLAFKFGGVRPMLSIAWALMVTALETDSQSHREWIMTRFVAMSSHSYSYERARVFLAAMLQKQADTEQHINVLEELASGQFESFVVQ